MQPAVRRAHSAPPTIPAPPPASPAPVPAAPAGRPSPGVAPTRAPTGRGPARARRTSRPGCRARPGPAAPGAPGCAPPCTLPGSGSRPLPGTRSRSTARSGSSWARMKFLWTRGPRPASACRWCRPAASGPGCRPRGGGRRCGPRDPSRVSWSGSRFPAQPLAHRRSPGAARSAAPPPRSAPASPTRRGSLGPQHEHALLAARPAGAAPRAPPAWRCCCQTFRASVFGVIG